MNLRGCYVALVTPFNSDCSLNEAGLRSNIDYLLENGVAGVIPCGTTGESATLTWEEHNRVVDITVNHVKGRCQVIAGAGSNNTWESIKAARHAQEAGANAVLCITPYYNKPTQEGLFQHYKTITEKVDIPMVVYNVPGRTGVNMLPETVERLCAFKNIVAVKEASGDVGQISEIHRRCGERMTVLSGDDGLTLPILSVGGVGVISVTGNLLPRLMVQMIDAYLSSDTKTALRIHEQLFLVSKTLFIESSPAPIKAAMNHVGLAAGPVRLPLVDMSEGNKQKLLAVLKDGGFDARLLRSRQGT